jgi:hypothetical protein
MKWSIAKNAQWRAGIAPSNANHLYWHDCDKLLPAELRSMNEEV